VGEAGYVAVRHAGSAIADLRGGGRSSVLSVLARLRVAEPSSVEGCERLRSTLLAEELLRHASLEALDAPEGSSACCAAAGVPALDEPPAPSMLAMLPCVSVAKPYRCSGRRLPAAMESNALQLEVRDAVTEAARLDSPVHVHKRRSARADFPREKLVCLLCR
jgi:hypothetical protein